MRTWFLVYGIFFTLIPKVKAEESFFSQYDKNEKLKVKEKAKTYFEYYSNEQFDNIENLLHPEEVNFNNMIWMRSEEFSNFLKASGKDRQAEYKNLRIFDFNDCKKDSLARKYAVKMNFVFDNKSILAVSDMVISDTFGISRTADAGLVFKEITETGEWKIIGIFGLDVRTEGKTLQIEDEKIEIKKFEQGRIKVPIPTFFTNKKEDGNTISYFMPGETPNDAAIQIIFDSLKEQLDEYGYRWTLFILQNKQHSEILVRYITDGYLYEFNVIGSDGRRNKGLIAVLENNGKVILVNYFSYFNVYQDIHDYIIYSIKNIELY